MTTEIKTKVVVIGSGPSGYSAAFRCADLNLDTILIERYENLGGVCLNVGCIPSKALLHIAKVFEEVKNLEKHGIIFWKPSIDLDKIRNWKEKIIKKLTNGLMNMTKVREIKIIKGSAKFIDQNHIIVKEEKHLTKINFENAIIATGSESTELPLISQNNDHRIWNSTDALKLKEIPEELLIIGGGIIGLEMATIYHALGSKVDIIEIFDQIIPSADQDLIKILTKKIDKKINLMLKTQIENIEKRENGIYVTMKVNDHHCTTKRYDIILVSIGRKPNCKNIEINKIGIKTNHRGFISVNSQMQTNIPHIYAIGDIVGEPMLAHKGVHQGHIAAEVISGKKHFFDPKVIPSIAYTEPEIAWVGMTEKKAKEKDIVYESVIFPWKASGRAVASGHTEGLTKLIFNKKTRRIIGGAIAGNNASEILGEIGLAIEMGCDAEDIALTIHAHPTLHESIGLAAEIFEGKITDLPNLKTKRKKV